MAERILEGDPRFNRDGERIRLTERTALPLSLVPHSIPAGNARPAAREPARVALLPDARRLHAARADAERRVVLGMVGLFIVFAILLVAVALERARHHAPLPMAVLVDMWIDAPSGEIAR